MRVSVRDMCYTMLYNFLDTVSQKLSNNNVFTIAKRNVEGQDMLYQSMKLTNGIWCLAELKIQPGNNAVTVSTKPQFFLCGFPDCCQFLSINQNKYEACP